MLEKLGGRKFIGFVLVLVTATVLCFYAKIDGNIWMITALTALGAYVGSNVLAKKFGNGTTGG